jgi:SAM-dependent methyltransferase
MIELARARLRSSRRKANLTFQVDNAEELKEIVDESVDLTICIGAFEHMLDKRAVLASIYRVLKFGGRFFCLAPHADYIWYRTKEHAVLALQSELYLIAHAFTLVNPKFRCRFLPRPLVHALGPSDRQSCWRRSRTPHSCSFLSHRLQSRSLGMQGRQAPPEFGS